MQMAFSYVLTQYLPSALDDFEHSSAAIKTFASILYGKKKCDVQLMICMVLSVTFQTG